MALVTDLGYGIYHTPTGFRVFIALSFGDYLLSGLLEILLHPINKCLVLLLRAIYRASNPLNVTQLRGILERTGYLASKGKKRRLIHTGYVADLSGVQNEKV